MTWINAAQQERDHKGLRNVCGACGHEVTQQNPLVLSDDGYRIHRTHTTNPASGYYGRQQENPQ